MRPFAGDDPSGPLKNGITYGFLKKLSLVGVQPVKCA
jgi:hypothetical protein